MIKIIRIMLVVLFCQLCINVSGSNNKRKIYIDVVFPNTTVDTVSLEYQHNGWALTALDKITVLDTTFHNHFEIIPEENENILYLNIKNNNKYFLIHYFAEPGDSIQIYIDPGNIIFRGIGSAKYQCRYDMDKVDLAFPFSSIPMKYNTKNDNIVFDSLYYTNYISDALSNIKRLDAVTNCSLEVLNFHKDKLTDCSYNLLLANLLAGNERKILTKFAALFKNFADDAMATQKDSIRNELIRIYANRKISNFSIIPDSILAYSNEYLEFLSSLYFRREETFSKSLAIFRKPQIRLDGTNEIEEDFKGILRDRVITYYLIKRFADLPNISKQIDSSLTFVSDMKCRDLLLSLKQTNSKGSTAFGFQLPDFNNKIRTLEEFRGKILVVDFWFTGCSGCRIMAENMKPVAEHFKNNKNVVFLSVSADRDLTTWKKSVAQAIYTNKYSIDLYTEGRGTDHPIIKNFKVMAYPTLIMIDKDGKIITTSVIKPYNDKDKKKLISFIEKNI